MTSSPHGLPPMILGAGELQDRLVAAVLSGEKTATSSLYRSYAAEGEPLPTPGHQRLLARDGSTAAMVEVTSVELLPAHKITDQIARAEGEGFADAAQWRAAHEEFWLSVGELETTGLLDDELIVVEHLRRVPPEETPRL